MSKTRTVTTTLKQVWKEEENEEKIQKWMVVVCFDFRSSPSYSQSAYFTRVNILSWYSCLSYYRFIAWYRFQMVSVFIGFNCGMNSFFSMMLLCTLVLFPVSLYRSSRCHGFLFRHTWIDDRKRNPKSGCHDCLTPEIQPGPKLKLDLYVRRAVGI